VDSQQLVPLTKVPRALTFPIYDLKLSQKHISKTTKRTIVSKSVQLLLSYQVNITQGTSCLTMWGLVTTQIPNKFVAPWCLQRMLTISSSNTTPRDIPEGIRHRLLQRHLSTHVYCSTIYNSQVM
jgi:hypothetical protein